MVPVKVAVWLSTIAAIASLPLNASSLYVLAAHDDVVHSLELGVLGVLAAFLAVAVEPRRAKEATGAPQTA